VLLPEDSPSRDEIPEFAHFFIVETCSPLHADARSKQRQRSKKASQPGMTETLLGGKASGRLPANSEFVVLLVRSTFFAGKKGAPASGEKLGLRRGTDTGRLK
jgi:hypothetical protein